MSQNCGQGEDLETLKRNLRLLAKNPPPVLLLEGGDESSRMEMALYWAMLANCPSVLTTTGPEPEPCGKCPVCLQIAAREYMDLWLYDGRISNREDEEKPGLTRALRIENVRDLKASLNTRPHGEGRRVAVLAGMSRTREEAMNSLLKTLEEPGKFTLFVLLVSQRQQILPTLVSRSFCVTLPWKCSLDKNDSPLALSFAAFLRDGRGFLDGIGGKGALDAAMAADLLVCCQRSLTRVAAGFADKGDPLDMSLQPVARSEKDIARTYSWLMEAQKMLAATVAPARALEAFGTRLYLSLKRTGG